MHFTIITNLKCAGEKEDRLIRKKERRVGSIEKEGTAVNEESLHGKETDFSDPKEKLAPPSISYWATHFSST